MVLGEQLFTLWAHDKCVSFIYAYSPGGSVTFLQVILYQTILAFFDREVMPDKEIKGRLVPVVGAA